MKKILPLLMLGACSFSAEAQKLYVSASAGTLCYEGDLKIPNFPKRHPDNAFSAAISYQFVPGVLANLSFTGAHVKGADSRSGYERRNLDFQSYIYEGSVTFEKDFLGLGNGRWTPYIFAGTGVLHFNPYTFLTTPLPHSGTTITQRIYLQPLGTEGQGLPEYPGTHKYSRWTVSIPMGVGMKRKLSDRASLAMEFNWRKLFTDYLDDVSSYHFADTAVMRAERGELAAKMSYRADEIPGNHYRITAQRGNPNKKDAFYTVQVKMIYNIGRMNGLGSRF